MVEKIRCVCGGLGVLSILLWVGCIVGETPLAEPENAVDSSGLIGFWESSGQPGDEFEWTRFDFENSPKGWPSHTLKVSSETRRTNGSIDRGQTIAYLVKIRDAEYLHLLNAPPEAIKELDYSSWRQQEQREFQIWSIRRTEHAFELFAADQEKLGAVIQSDVSGALEADEINRVRERLESDGANSIFQDQVFMKFTRREKPASDQ